MPDIRARLGVTLRHWRARRRLTQEQLAERSGLSYKFIGEIERGRGNPTVETLGRLSDALSINIGDLFGGAEREPPDDTYQISRIDFQAVREALESIDEIVEQVESPRYPMKRRRRRR